jgi:hypothetical protein
MDDEANQNIAAMDNYINENFVHDPITGAFWTCIEGTLRTCNLVTLDQILLSAHTSIHDAESAKAALCMKGEVAVCGQSLKTRLDAKTPAEYRVWQNTYST